MNLIQNESCKNCGMVITNKSNINICSNECKTEYPLTLELREQYKYKLDRNYKQLIYAIIIKAFKEVDDKFFKSDWAKILCGEIGFNHARMEQVVKNKLAHNKT